MSWLSGLLGKAAPFIGGAIGSVVPGVGTAIGAGLGGALSGYLGGGGVKGAITGGAGGYLGGAGTTGLLRAVGGSVLGGAGGGGSAPSPDAGGGGGGLDLGGIVGSGANWLAHNPNVLLAGGAAVSGIQKQNQADAYRKQALDAATGSYNERAPVRTAALANLSDNSTPDLSADFASSNPFQRKLRRVT